MYRVKLNEKLYLNYTGRIRLWEEITPVTINPYMHCYDLGICFTPIKTLASLFVDKDQLNDIFNDEGFKIIYPDAIIEEV